jgi:hypothetical protein
MSSAQLKYKTFDELLAEVLVDFHTFNLEGMIDPAQLIKVAQRVNYELGMRLHQPKDAVLELRKGKAKLPTDFYILNYANLCGKYHIEEPVIHGTHIVEKLVDIIPDNSEMCGVKPCVSNCGQYMYLVQELKTQTRTYNEFYPLRISDGKMVDPTCPNLGVQSANTAKLKDGFMYTNVETGNVHLNYMGDLTDDEGNLLVLDHPLANEFYEYAIKQRILENLFMNGEDVSQRIQLIEQRLRSARNNAYSFINTPNFQEMQKLWETNRKAMYGKYYDMFKR